MGLVYAILVVQYTVHMQMSEWYWFLRPPSRIVLLLDREFNLSQKHLEVPIREKLDSRNIWRIQLCRWLCPACHFENSFIDGNDDIGYDGGRDDQLGHH